MQGNANKQLSSEKVVYLVRLREEASQEKPEDKMKLSKDREDKKGKDKDKPKL